MADLVKRLRVCAAFDPDQAEAADRIEKDAQHIDEMYALVAAMNADHTASKTRIEKLEAGEIEFDRIIGGYASENARFRDRIEKLEAALRVYADEDHWFGDKFEPIMFPEGECKCCYEHFSDQGEIARKALEGKDD